MRKRRKDTSLPSSILLTQHPVSVASSGPCDSRYLIIPLISRTAEAVSVIFDLKVGEEIKMTRWHEGVIFMKLSLTAQAKR